MTDRRVSVLLPLPLAGAYDYGVPGDMRVAPGDFVTVPLGARQATGVVWDTPPSGVASARLKNIAALRVDMPPLPDISRRFVDWVAGYTLAPSGAVLRLVTGGTQGLQPLKRQPSAKTERLIAPAVPPGPGVTLSAAQEQAALQIGQALQGGSWSALVLDGVTGSGKTEVYAKGLEQVLNQGGQALVLLPEIALTSATLARLRGCLGVEPLAWHSGLTPAQRRKGWKDVATGKAQLMVGARSALFLPFADLRLIVVDEEHDGSYRQEDGVLYHARDMAVARAWLGGAVVVLASATPSLETLANVDNGRYARLVLPDRVGAARMPDIKLVDVRTDKPPKGAWLSPSLRTALQETLQAGQQSLVFLNRRGYAPLSLCRSCGHRMICPNCTAWLVAHDRGRSLQCHHCGHGMPSPSSCPSCHAPGPLAGCGPGIERVHEEVAALLPGARLACVASDSPLTANAQALQAMEQGGLDVLIGTQLVVKGHHFPNLTLVGVVDADLGLGGADPRAAERCFQVLHQVSGRSGRAQMRGRALIQTTQPEHPVMKALAQGDRDGLMRALQGERKAFDMPPFGRWAALVLSGTDEAQVTCAAHDLIVCAPRLADVRILGPAPAPMARLRGRHRQRLLIKTKLGVRLQPIVSAWLAQVTPSRTVRLQVDMDPYSFL
ncbi:MAG: primosomal protein N' [Alphaproteobacteria bacterium]|nr:MAG: primosomal protein N' [Alphaproteobacteria bacterium]